MNKIKKIIVLIMLFVISLFIFEEVRANDITWNDVTVNGKETVYAKYDTKAGFDYKKGFRLKVIKANSEFAFCVEPNVMIKSGEPYKRSEINYSDESMRKAAIAKWLTFDKRAYAGKESNPDTRDGYDYSLTQMLIWKLGGEAVDMNAWFDYGTIKDFIEAGEYEVNKWDVWPEYVDKEFEIEEGQSLLLEGYNQGKIAYTDAEDVKIDIKDSEGNYTNTENRYNNIINKYKRQVQITVGSKAPDRFEVYLSQEDDYYRSKMNNSGSVLLYESEKSQNIISGGHIKPDIRKITIKVKKKGIKIKKKDESGNNLENVGFVVASDKDFNNIVGEVLTDSNGEAKIQEGLSKIDRLYIKENKAPMGYLIDNNIKEVELNKDGITEIEIINKKIKGKIEITKNRKSWSKEGDLKENEVLQPEEGVLFDIYNEQNVLVDTISTDNRGKAVTKELEYGKYLIVQKNEIEGTKKAENKIINIDTDNKIYELNIVNENKKSKLKIIKCDENGNNINIEGIKFKLYDSNNNPIQVNGKTEFVTDRNGEILIDSYLPYGDYILKEIYMPDNKGYTINNEEVRIRIDGESDLTELKFKNKEQKGSIIVNKLGKTIKNIEKCNKYGYEVTKVIQEDEKLKGVTFELIDEDGTILERTTNEDGIAKFENLKLGKYILIEKNTLEEYIKDDSEFVVELKSEKSDVEIVKKDININNKRKRLNVKLNKFIEKSKLNEEYKNIGFDNVIFGIYSKEDSKYYKKDQLIDVSKLDTDYSANFELFDDGKFYIKELSTGEMYVIDSEEKLVEFNYRDIKSEELLVVESNNMIKKGNIKLIKSRKHDGKKLQGIKFTLKTVNGKFIADYITDENGELMINDLEYGDYVLTELENEEYLDIQPIKFSIKENDELLEYNIENEKIPELITTATVNGEKEVHALEKVNIVDKVNYKYIIPGEKYILKAKLIDKKSGEIITVDGIELSKDIELVSDKESGNIEIKFELDVSKINAQDIVIVEELYKDGINISNHNDLNDKDQTVVIKKPSIHTKANINGIKKFRGNSNVKIVDEIEYKNLYENNEYEIVASLIDRNTGKNIYIDGKEVEKRIKFIPKSSSGNIYVDFDIDLKDYENVDIVVFDKLYLNNEMVFEHCDINNVDQTIKYERNELPKTSVSGVGSYIFTLIISSIMLSLYIIIRDKNC